MYYFDDIETKNLSSYIAFLNRPINTIKKRITEMGVHEREVKKCIISEQNNKNRKTLIQYLVTKLSEKPKPINENQCYICDITLNEDITVIKHKHRFFCEDCFYDEYTYCEDCGEATHNDDIYTVNGDSYVCEDCRDNNYRRCHDCDNYVSNDDTYGDNYITLCNECFDSGCYSICYDCGCIISEDDSFIYDDESYCESCLPADNIIHDYGYKPEPEFNNIKGEPKTKLYYGIELEIDKGGHDSEKAQKLLDITEDIYIKHDSSIDNGFEIVSHPCTYNYHLKEFPWDDILTKSIKMRYYSHNTSTCGLHIHVSRNYFGEPGSDKNDLNIMKLLFLTQNNLWDKLLLFSRRTESSMNQWAKRYSHFHNPEELLDEAKNYAGRHYAINISNYTTIEFRFFRGTLKYNTFIASLQLTRMLCEISISMNINDIQNTTWEDIIEYAYNNQFYEFIAYCEERNLLE